MDHIFSKYALQDRDSGNIYNLCSECGYWVRDGVPFCDSESGRGKERFQVNEMSFGHERWNEDRWILIHNYPHAGSPPFLVTALF